MKDPSKYFYTNQGSVEVLNEKNDHKSTNSAFRTLGFEKEEIDTVWRIVASILHLGNIHFQSKYLDL